MCDKLNALRKLYVSGNYEKTAKNLLDKCQWNIIPVDISYILDCLNIPFNSKDFSESEHKLQESDINQGIQGMIHVTGENIDIFYNKKFNPTQNSTPKEKDSCIHKINFTLAHELAHSIIHTRDIDENGGFLDFYRLDDDLQNNDEKEVEANTLAGEILMPKEIFIASFAACKLSGKSFEETLNSLSILFNVSVNVINARIKYLQL
ncbi:MAG: ImmA/IrrE family metallo-endopeptidase [Massilimicrobiota timonensis]